MQIDAQVVRRLRDSGGAAHLLALGGAAARDQIDAGLRSGRLIRVRRGWYALVDAPREVVRAVRVGGVLTAGSAAALAGVWVPRDDLLHVRVARNAARLRSPDLSRGAARLDPRRDRVCLHYRSDPAPVSARDPLPIALAEMLRCAETGAAIAAVDSALARGLLTPREFEELEALASGAGRRLLERVSAGSESGIETKVRLLLRSRRVRHRTQVRIDGVGRVDLLVGDRLVIEVDGSAYHSGDFEFENDRRRDFELALRGYLVLRLSYRMVTEHWDVTRRGILDLIERGEHRWGVRAAARTREGARMPGLERIDDAGPETWGMRE